MRRLVVLVLVVAGCGGNDEPEVKPPTPLQREIRQLADAMEATHPDLFHDVSRAAFRSATTQLAEQAPALGREGVVVGLMRLTAMAGKRDGHTGIFPFDRHSRPLHVYPLRLYDFADGLYAVAALGEQSIVGRRLTSIGGRPVADVVELVRPLVPHDNESGRRWLLPEYLTTAEVLRGLGIAKAGAVPFGFEGGIQVRLAPHPAQDVAASLGSARGPLPAVGDPVWLRNLGDGQWLTTLESGRVVYLGYRATTGATDDLAERLLRLSSKAAVRRVVVDVRLNHGGNNQTYGPLLDVLARPAIGSKLVLLTGRETFSAAGNFVADVARHTKAQIVGEPAGGAPSQWGDSTSLDLPRAGLTAHVATVYHDYGPAEAAQPDVLVAPTAAQFFAGRDPVLERALTLP